MVITMKASKTLYKTLNSKLFQGENAVDSVVFYVSSALTDNVDNLEDYICTLYYTNPVNEAYMEVLEKEDESDKTGYLKYKLPITTKITKVAGDIEIQLVFSNNDEETNTQHVLKSGKLRIKIDEFLDHFKYIPNDSLSSLENKIQELDTKADELQAIAEEIQVTTPDDLKLDKDILHLSKDGEKIGQGVEILVPGNPDLEDDAHDGIIDLNDVEPDPPGPTPEIPVFVEL